MPKWTDYTTKTDPADKDEMMILDTAGKANKRLGLSALSDWIIGKIANKVFENLQTQNKTILGAINELNSNPALGIKMSDCTVRFEYYQHRALFYVTNAKTSDEIRIDFNTEVKTISVQKNNVDIGSVNLS